MECFVACWSPSRRRSPRAVWTFVSSGLLSKPFDRILNTGNVNYTGLQGAPLGLSARVPGFASIAGDLSPSNSAIPDSIPGFTNSNVIRVPNSEMLPSSSLPHPGSLGVID